MGIGVIDPQIANRVRSRRRARSNQSYTVPNLDGRTGVTGSTKRGANVVDAGDYCVVVCVCVFERFALACALSWVCGRLRAAFECVWA